MSFFVVALTFVNISLWIIFLIRFKKIFSTDNIIEQTKIQMNQLIKDIDSATDRNMYLVKEGKKSIENLLKESEDCMQKFSEASMRLRGMIAETEKQKSKANQSSPVLEEFNKTQLTRKKLTNPQIETYLKNSRSINKSEDEASYEVVKDAQQELFSSNNASSILKDETILTKDGAAYKEVPLIITEIYDEKPEQITQDNIQSSEDSILTNQVISENSLQQKVSQLHSQGISAEEIAQKLSCSITEVDFIIQML